MAFVAVAVGSGEGEAVGGIWVVVGGGWVGVVEGEVMGGGVKEGKTLGVTCPHALRAKLSPTAKVNFQMGGAKYGLRRIVA